jgi:flagellar motor switch protein FliN/FliY
MTLINTAPKPSLNGAADSQRNTLIDAVGVSVETYLGAAQLTVAELNALSSGSLVSLDAALNTPVELRVNGVAIARGELVAIGDKFGVRIIAISP